MKRLLFLTLSALCAASFAQLPDYVPTEGLVGWWPFAGDAQDQSGNGHDGVVDGAALTTDRFGNANSAYFFDGVDDLIQTNIAFSQLSNSAGLSGTAWIKLGSAESFFGHTIISNHAPSNTQFWFGLVGSESEEDEAKLSVGYKATNAGFQNKTCSTHPIEVGTWTHVGFSISTDFIRFYINGQLIDQQTSNFEALGQESVNVPDVKMGQGNPTNGFRQDFDGSIDEVGLWTNALSDGEFLQLFTALLNGSECADTSNACGYCLEGTKWDESLQGCVPDNPSDLNRDGCVDVQDFMGHLSAFGDGCNGNPQTFIWQCGDPLEYQGYNYNTVQIGEQCWFSENLRAENYANGDAILDELDDNTWSYTQEGATTIYGADEGCQEVFPAYDACDPVVSLAFFGRLYNWFAVNDARKLCPTGWSIPSNNDVDDLLLHFPDASGLKSTDGWKNEGNGTNASGYNGWPGGVRYQENTTPDGEYGSAGSDGHWWTSTESGGSSAFDWYMSYDTSVVGRQAYPKNFGFSIRCIIDKEE